MAYLHNPVCAIPIAGPKTGMCSPQGILIRDNHLVVLCGGNTSGIKIIDVKELLNKSRALLQLETNDVDAQPEAEASIRASPSGKVKIDDVCFWSVCFQSSSALASYGESVFVCDTSNQAIRIISSLTAYKVLGEKVRPFIELFQLEEECSRKASVQSNLEDGLKILKDVAYLMKDIEKKAYFRTERRCP